MCGMSSPSNKCWIQNILSGEWSVTPHTLAYGRNDASYWPVEEGIILMGGCCSDDIYTSSELVRHDGGVEKSFDLRYEVR